MSAEETFKIKKLSQDEAKSYIQDLIQVSNKHGIVFNDFAKDDVDEWLFEDLFYGDGYISVFEINVIFEKTQLRILKGGYNTGYSKAGV